MPYKNKNQFIFKSGVCFEKTKIFIPNHPNHHLHHYFLFLLQV